MCSILQSDNHQTTSTQGSSLLHLLFETKLTRYIEDLYLQEDEVALLDDEGKMEQITTSNDADNFQDNCDDFGQMETKAEETLYLQEDEVALLDDEGTMEQITTSSDADNFQDNCDDFGQMETKAEETGMFLKPLHPNVMKQSTSAALFDSTPGSGATQKPSWSPKKTI
jgi:hypothetical protein